MNTIKPFYSKRRKDWVVDEICECGKLRSEHGSLVQKVGDQYLRLAGEGNAEECKRYRFFEFVTAKRYAAMMFKRRKKVA